MKIEMEGKQLLFTSAYVLCLIDAIVFGYSSFGSLPGANAVSKCLCIAALFFILIKLLIDGFYSLFYLCTMFFVGLLFLITYVKSGYNHILYFMIAFLGMRNMKSSQILKIDFFLKITLTSLIIACSLSGIIENYVTHRTGEHILRYSLGFNHPNTLASIVFSLIVEEAFLRARKPSGFYTVLIWGIDYILYQLTANRTAVMLIAAFPLLLLILNRETTVQHANDPSLRISLFSLSYPAAFLCSMLIMQGTRKITFLTLIDRWFSNRFYNANVIYHRYGLSLLGQKVILISVRLARLMHSSIALLDVAYLRLLIQAGPLVLACIILLYCFAINQMAQNNRRWALFVTLLFVLFGFCESGTNNVFINFSILLILEEFYRSEKLIVAEADER